MTKIESNVPLPTIRHKAFWDKFPMKELELQQSFAVPIAEVVEDLRLTTIQAGIHSRARRAGIKVKTAMVVEKKQRVVRVWRIE